MHYLNSKSKSQYRIITILKNYDFILIMYVGYTCFLLKLNWLLYLLLGSPISFSILNFVRRFLNFVRRLSSNYCFFHFKFCEKAQLSCWVQICFFHFKFYEKAELLKVRDLETLDQKNPKPSFMSSVIMLCLV